MFIVLSIFELIAYLLFGDERTAGPNSDVVGFIGRATCEAEVPVSEERVGPAN